MKLWPSRRFQRFKQDTYTSRRRLRIAWPRDWRHIHNDEKPLEEDLEDQEQNHIIESPEATKKRGG